MSVRNLTVALVGNPNAGKTTLFNALCGLRQRVGNYPGVTVETKKGRWSVPSGHVDLIDLPGTYSLAPRSPDETLAVELLLGHSNAEPTPDVIIAVVDASNLDRHLYLVTQLFELGRPIVIALTMTDLADRSGISVDTNQLAKRLGVPVVAVVAPQSRGLCELAQAVQCARADRLPVTIPFPEIFEQEANDLAEKLPHISAFYIRRLLFDVDGAIENRFATTCTTCMRTELDAARARLAAAGCPVPAVEARTRYEWIRRATAGAVTRPKRPPLSTTDRLDRLLTHKLWGTLIFIAVMAVVFQSIFTAAVPLMNGIKLGKDRLADVVRDHFPPGPATSLFADGVIEGVGSVIVFLPQILIMFAFLAFLEDCGYMARAAFLMDKFMSRAGLSGKSFIPLLSSMACAVPGIMATRVIENRRDRLATILVAPLMSCSARLPVYTLLIAAFLTEGHAWWLPGLTLFAMYMIGILVAPLVAWTLKRTLLRGPAPVFVMEMPEYQWPAMRSVLLRMYDRAIAFVVRAGTFILASMILVWALLYFPCTDETGTSYDVRIAELSHRPDTEREIAALNGEWRRQSFLGHAGRWIEPIVAPLGWDWKIGMAALASFPAREVMVGVLGQVYNLGRHDSDELREPLGQALKSARWHDDPTSQAVFTVPTALSVMVFFALCCQCASTLAVIRRETGSWKWPAFTFTYMTALAYAGAFVVYQIGSSL